MKKGFQDEFSYIFYYRFKKITLLKKIKKNCSLNSFLVRKNSGETKDIRSRVEEDKMEDLDIFLVIFLDPHLQIIWFL